MRNMFLSRLSLSTLILLNFEGNATSFFFRCRYFIGTYESTFSFRIYEEREILNFDPDTTFNRLCGDEEAHCEAPSRWRIAY